MIIFLNDMDSTLEAGMKFIHAKYGFEPILKTEFYINDIKELDWLSDRII